MSITVIRVVQHWLQNPSTGINKPVVHLVNGASDSAGEKTASHIPGAISRSVTSSRAEETEKETETNTM